MGKTAAELRAYIDGRDPISRRPVMQEVIDGLMSTGDVGHFDAQGRQKVSLSSLNGNAA